MHTKTSGCAPRWRKCADRDARPGGRRDDRKFQVKVTDFDGGGAFVRILGSDLPRGDVWKRRILAAAKADVKRGVAPVRPTADWN